MSDYDFSKSELNTLRFLYLLAVIAFIALGGAIIHNSWRYLYKEKLGSTMVIMFYVLSAIVTVSYIAFYMMLTIDPCQSPYLFQEKGFTLNEFLLMIGIQAMLSINWLVATTMYHLKVTITVIFKVFT